MSYTTRYLSDYTLTVVTSLMTSLVALSFIILSSVSVSADIIDDVSITVPVSCNMTSELDTTHTATINPGQSQSDIGTTTFKVICNDNSGFAIYAIGYSNEEYGNTKLLATINNQQLPANDINTGTATSGSTSAWAMKLTPVTGTYAPTIESDTNGSFASYHVVPTEYTKVATFASNTDFTIGSSLQSTYRAYIASTQPAGTYEGKVRYTLVHPGSTATNAIRIAQEIDDWKDDLVIGDEITIMDARDHKLYSAAKMPDGNIWMTQNLDFNLDSSKTYTNLDTDIGYNPNTGEYDSASWSPMRSTYAPNDYHYCQGCATDERGAGTNNYTPESYDPGDIYWNGVINSEYEDSSNYISESGDSHYHFGNWYNWSAAVALNDSSSYNTELNVGKMANQSICPSGWTLPRPGYGSGSYYYLLLSSGFDVQKEISSRYKGSFMGNSIADSKTLWGAPLYLNLAGYDIRPGFYGVGSESYYHTAYSYSYRSRNDYTMYVYSVDFYAPDDYVGGFAEYGGQYFTPIRCVARPVPDTIIMETMD